MYLPLNTMFNIQPFSPPVIFQWSMVILCTTALLFTWWGRLHLGILWSPGITEKEHHDIRDDGPYRIVRHPIYFGLIAAFLVFALAKPTLWTFLGFGLITVGFYKKANLEERFLSDKLEPGKYEDYKKRTPGLIPLFRITRVN